MGITQQSAAARLIQPGVCTSTTRPVSPFEGQAIFETDTDRVLYWNGTTWYPAWNQAWGQIGYATKTTDQSFTTKADMAGLSISFTAVANRVYQMTFSGNIYIASGGDSAVYLTDGTTDYYESLGSVLSTAPYQSRSFTTHITGLSAGAKTFKIQAFGTSTATMYGTGIRPSISARLIIQDIGPV